MVISLGWLLNEMIDSGGQKLECKLKWKILN